MITVYFRNETKDTAGCFIVLGVPWGAKVLKYWNRWEQDVLRFTERRINSTISQCQCKISVVSSHLLVCLVHLWCCFLSLPVSNHSNFGGIQILVHSLLHHKWQLCFFMTCIVSVLACLLNCSACACGGIWHSISQNDPGLCRIATRKWQEAETHGKCVTSKTIVRMGMARK